jgi:tRNA pseudouridine55 synthase
MSHASVPAPRPEGVPADWAGLLLVDKPTGVTSHDVVAMARRALRIKGIGHLGTLDPNASGLLVLAVGVATRCIRVWQGGQKTYAGTARFGVVTDSQDTQGQVLATSDARPDEAAIRAAAAALTGDLQQIPPMVSALKHEGERLYDIARRGGTVERAPRAIRVEAWRWGAFTRDTADFEVDCSGGTYVRTLVHDLGAALGMGATLAALRRLRSAPFDLADACPASALREASPAEVLARAGRPLDRALDVLPAVPLTYAQAEAIGRGQSPRVPANGAPIGVGECSVVLRDETGRALALAHLEAAGDGAMAFPDVVFPWAVREGRLA